MDGLLQVLVGVDLDRDFHLNRKIGTLIYPRVLRVNHIVLPSGKPRRNWRAAGGEFERVGGT